MPLVRSSTPKAFFEALSTRALDWANVKVTLVDERFVPEDEWVLTSSVNANRFYGILRIANAGCIDKPNGQPVQVNNIFNNIAGGSWN